MLLIREIMYCTTMKEMEKLMSGYHENVEYGRREVYKSER